MKLVALLSLISRSIVLSTVCLLTLCIFLFVFPYPPGCAEHKTGIKKEAYGKDFEQLLLSSSFLLAVEAAATAILHRLCQI